jgi:hypothetical protein
MYEEGASVAQCAISCNDDEECVAFDYNAEDGFCYAYKQDPLADYVGSGAESWQCYTHTSIPDSCSPVYQGAVDVLATVFNYVHV